MKWGFLIEKKTSAIIQNIFIYVSWKTFDRERNTYKQLLNFNDKV